MRLPRHSAAELIEPALGFGTAELYNGLQIKAKPESLNGGFASREASVVW